jgi:dipeptidyl aminopeptidase/acylaminoacyl peptidase
VAVIFPNVRGSAGYGKTFLTLDNALLREDSYKDVNALFDWIATRPDLDAGKVLVTGGSYGGFMTFAIATNYDERICCSISVVGISNLRTFLERTEAYRRDLRRAEYGDERDPKTREFFERIAAVNNAQRITKPIFVVQGRNDPRVPWTESQQIVDTLQQKSTPVWYLLADDEGHGFAKKKNADFQFYSSVMFVRRYLLGQGE